MNIAGVIIDAAHGGTDVGNSENGNYEKDFTLGISLYIYNRLKELGIPVQITRTSDQALSNEERINKIKNFYGASKDIILISNHVNSNKDGTNVIYALRNSNQLSNLIVDELRIEGQVNLPYQKRLPSDTTKDYYFIHRDTSPINAVMIEYSGNIAQLKKDEKIYGEAIVRAILRYINKPYTSNDNANYYVVKMGDSLWSIANKYKTTVSDIKSINNLSTDNLQIGQTLKIPTSNQENSKNIYTVQSGDTLFMGSGEYQKRDNKKHLNCMSFSNHLLNFKVYFF